MFWTLGHNSCFIILLIAVVNKFVLDTLFKASFNLNTT